MERGKRSVADIIDIECLQDIQDSLGRIVGITMVLLDPDGFPLSRPTNMKAFCAMMRVSKNGFQMCVKTNSALIAENQKTGKPAVMNCPNSGLKTAAVPIFYGEEYLGSWLIEQIRMSDIDYRLIEQTAKEVGLEKRVAMENISMLPVITPEEFDNIMSFLITSTKALTNMVKTNAELAERNEELENLTSKLNDSAKAFREFIDLGDVGALLSDYYTDEVLIYNNVYKSMLGIADGDEELFYDHMVGNKEVTLFSDAKEKLLDSQGEPGRSYTREFYHQPTDKWYRLTSRALHWMDNRLAIMSTMIDITSRKKEEERIAYLAYYDQKLGLANAVKLGEDLQSAIGPGTYMVCLNIKGLRGINNVYGRAAGDALLSAIVTWLQNLPYLNTEVYRVQGDNFAIMIRGCSYREVEGLAKRIFARFDFDWPADMDGIAQAIYTGVYIGIILIDKPNEFRSSFIDIIERVLSFARKENHLIVFDHHNDEEFRRDMQLKVALKHCIQNDMEGFYLNYQPIVDARTGKWKAMEALCRWNHHDIGYVSPEVFIAETEQFGLVGILSEWVFKEAVRQVKEWKLDEVPGFYLSLNLSPVQLLDQELAARMKALLKRYDFSPACLELEVIETQQVHFDEKTVTQLEAIRAAGISLSLDDFGTGYATFSNIRNIPVAMLKTDRSFVSDIEWDPLSREMIQIIVQYARAAGMRVTAEGVETAEQHQIVADIGVNMIQGYFFSKPLSKEDMGGQLERYW